MSEYRPYETSRGDEVANEKRLNRVAASFGDSEFNALSRLANADNRSVSEYLYVIAMRFMFGAAGVDRKQNDCDTLQQRERA